MKKIKIKITEVTPFEEIFSIVNEDKHSRDDNEIVFLLENSETEEFIDYLEKIILKSFGPKV